MVTPISSPTISLVLIGGARNRCQGQRGGKSRSTGARGNGDRCVGQMPTLFSPEGPLAQPTFFSRGRKWEGTRAKGSCPYPLRRRLCFLNLTNASERFRFSPNYISFCHYDYHCDYAAADADYSGSDDSIVFSIVPKFFFVCLFSITMITHKLFHLAS